MKISRLEVFFGFNNLIILKIVLIYLSFLSLLYFSFQPDKNDFKYKPPKKDFSLFIAAMLRNNEEIFDWWSEMILKIIEKVGRDKVFLSIYESFSQDGTSSKLLEFKQKVESLNIKSSIVVDGVDLDTLRKSYRRIERLSSLRNLALVEPLLKEYSKGNKYDRILFLNDIIFTEEDFWRLLYTRDGEYSVACGLDYYWSFYDTYATRDLKGNQILSGYYPFVENYEERNKVIILFVV